VLLHQDTPPSVQRVHVVDVKMAVGGRHQQPGKLLDAEEDGDTGDVDTVTETHSE